MNKIFALLVGFSAAVVCGCTSVNINLPLSRLDSPETNGSDRPIRLATGATAFHALEVTSDASSRPLNTSAPSLKSGTTAMFAGQFGVLNNLDLGVRTTLGQAPVMATAKFQLIGEPAASAKAGNFSLSLAAGLGFWQSKQSGDQNGVFGPGGFPWSAQITEKSFDSSVILGYRTADKFLLYSSLFYTHYGIDVDIEQSKSDDGTSPAASYGLDYGGYQRGVNLGFEVELSKLVSLWIEGVHAKVHFPHGLEDSVNQLGANVAFLF